MPFSKPHGKGEQLYAIVAAVFVAGVLLWIGTSLVFQSVETKNDQGFTSNDLEQVQDDVTNLLCRWSGNPHAKCPVGLVKREGSSWVIECTDLIDALATYTNGRQPNHEAMEKYLTKEWKTSRVTFTYGFSNYLRHNVSGELVEIYNNWGNPVG